MYSNPFSASNVADDLFSGDGIAATRAVDEDVVGPLHDKRSGVPGLLPVEGDADDAGLRRGSLRRPKFFWEELRDDLPR